MKEFKILALLCEDVIDEKIFSASDLIHCRHHQWVEDLVRENTGQILVFRIVDRF